jgi:hypothetical protein
MRQADIRYHEIYAAIRLDGDCRTRVGAYAVDRLRAL